MTGKANVTGARAHSMEARASDLYETPAIAVQALMEAESLPTRIWEPACGPGAIVRELRAAGHEVFGTDLHEYDAETQSLFGLDFTNLPAEFIPPFAGHFAIVTNPPFSAAQAFAETAIKVAPKVCLLLRLAFLESERRTKLLEDSGLARVHVFRKRLPMMHRAGWDGPKASSAMAFAWFTWIQGYTGPPKLFRI